MLHYIHQQHSNALHRKVTQPGFHGEFMFISKCLCSQLQSLHFIDLFYVRCELLWQTEL